MELSGSNGVKYGFINRIEGNETALLLNSAEMVSVLLSGATVVCGYSRQTSAVTNAS